MRIMWHMDAINERNELWDLRLAHGVSQRRLAMYLGLSNTEVGRWERAQVVSLERLALYRQVLPLIVEARKGAA